MRHVNISRWAQAQAVPLALPGAIRLYSHSISRRELLLWLSAALFASQLLDVPADFVKSLANTLELIFFSKSAFFYLGWYAVISLFLDGGADRLSTKSEVAAGVFICTLNLLYPQIIVWISTTVVAIYLLLTSRDDRRLRAGAAVLLALALNGFWGPKLFRALSYYVLSIDAAIVGSILTATQPGMVWHDTILGTPGGHSIFIYGPCSSFHNISAGLLCWVSLTKLARTSWIASDILFALSICATTVLFNGARLYMMALSPEHYTFWHQGLGSDLFAWGTALAVLLLSLWGALHARRAT